MVEARYDFHRNDNDFAHQTGFNGKAVSNIFLKYLGKAAGKLKEKVSIMLLFPPFSISERCQQPFEFQIIWISGIPPFNIIILNGGIPLGLDYITTNNLGTTI